MLLERVSHLGSRATAAAIEPRISDAIDRAGVPTNRLGVDPWGFSPEASKIYFSLAYQVYRYFRPAIRGAEHIPASGRVLLIGNHSGQLPFDGLVVAVAALLDAPSPRMVRPMAERWFVRLPFINEAFSRAGVVLGDPVNAKNLLDHDQALLVFPEGVRGSGKTWDHRYKLVEFGRGFMRLALQTGTPIIPFSVVGGEESIISLYDLKPIARLFRMPYFPVPALLPVLGPLSFLPLPVRFHVTFGEPMRFTGPFDDEDEVIEGKVKQVAERVQALIDDGLAHRKGVFA